MREVYQIAGKKCICWNIDGMGGIKGQRREMSNPVRLIFLLQVNIQIPRMNLDNFKMKYTFTRPHRTETHLHCGGVWCSKWMANMVTQQRCWKRPNWIDTQGDGSLCTAAVSARFQYSSAITRWSSELKNCDDTPAIPRYCAGILGSGYSNGYCGGNTYISMYGGIVCDNWYSERQGVPCCLPAGLHSHQPQCQMAYHTFLPEPSNHTN